MRLSLRKWATGKLKTGDLTALDAMARGGKTSETERVKRLVNRGFITEKRDGKVSVTTLGRMALVIRRFMFFFDGLVA